MTYAHPFIHPRKSPFLRSSVGLFPGHLSYVEGPRFPLPSGSRPTEGFGQFLTNNTSASSTKGKTGSAPVLVKYCGYSGCTNNTSRGDVLPIGGALALAPTLAAYAHLESTCRNRTRWKKFSPHSQQNLKKKIYNHCLKGCN